MESSKRRTTRKHSTKKHTRHNNIVSKYLNSIRQFKNANAPERLNEVMHFPRTIAKVPRTTRRQVRSIRRFKPVLSEIAEGNETANTPKMPKTPKQKGFELIFGEW